MFGCLDALIEWLPAGCTETQTSFVAAIIGIYFISAAWDKPRELAVKIFSVLHGWFTRRYLDCLLKKQNNAVDDCYLELIDKKSEESFKTLDQKISKLHRVLYCPSALFCTAIGLYSLFTGDVLTWKNIYLVFPLVIMMLGLLNILGIVTIGTILDLRGVITTYNNNKAMGKNGKTLVVAQTAEQTEIGTVITDKESQLKKIARPAQQAKGVNEITKP